MEMQPEGCRCGLHVLQTVTHLHTAQKIAAPTTAGSFCWQRHRSGPKPHRHIAPYIKATTQHTTPRISTAQCSHPIGPLKVHQCTTTQLVISSHNTIIFLDLLLLLLLQV